MKSIRILYSDTVFILIHAEPILVSTQRHVSGTGLEGDRVDLSDSLYANPIFIGKAQTLECYQDVYLLDVGQCVWWNEIA